MNFRSLLDAIRNFFSKPVSKPVTPVSIPQEEQGWKPPVGPATNPVATAAPVPVTGTKAPEPGTLAWWEALPPSTQAYYPKPGSDAANTLQSRVGNTPGVEYPIVAVPTGFIQPIRLRCLLHGGIVYRSALNGFGLVISPTANDPAGQSAMYSAREVDANGNLIFDYGRVYKTMIVNKGSGIVEVSSDATSEVWYEVRG